MEKTTILEMLRSNGFRITKQREILIDIILKDEYRCCKEIFYLAQKQDPGIGIATIYRTINALEDIGVLERKAAIQFAGNKK